MEKCAEQRIYKAEEAKTVALEHAEAPQRGKDMALKHAEEVEQQKVLFEEQAHRAEQKMKEAIELAKDSAYRAQKAERDLAAEAERARNTEKELLRQLKLAQARQREMESEHNRTVQQATIKREESVSATARRIAESNRSVQDKGTATGAANNTGLIKHCPLSAMKNKARGSRSLMEI
ncbi:hypothetical protein DL766_006926 [Monosporascus sp. MC13-8B]|uniref:Uncharacterized protein n=1 Tax=Monosporascus cannonballus TaxID=155416 RepID=A0ABY0HC05_9PEZI|nr:hypothetical protein DL763_009758 [Monosporascus cannonballus]RYO89911.1 hypothetical protein DL762_002996 [Monosporascus cannonballus]RYP25742.1 hypothetical protein DL766_006926 [Monosporascus sp. MC13-8B]